MILSEQKYEDNLIFPDGVYIWMLGDIKFPIMIFNFQMIVLN